MKGLKKRLKDDIVFHERMVRRHSEDLKRVKKLLRELEEVEKRLKELKQE